MCDVSQIIFNALSWVPICMPMGFVPRLLQAPHSNCSSNWWSDNPISTGNVPQFPRPPHHHHVPLVAQPANSSPWERRGRQSKFPEALQTVMQTVIDRLTVSSQTTTHTNSACCTSIGVNVCLCLCVNNILVSGCGKRRNSHLDSTYFCTCQNMPEM